MKPITEIKKLINDCKLAEGLAKSIIIQCKKLPISYLFNGFFFELAHKWIFGDDQSNDLNNRDHSIFNHEFKIVWNTEFIDWEDYDLDYIAVKDVSNTWTYMSPRIFKLFIIEIVKSG